MSSESVGELLLRDVEREFAGQRSLAERAVQQIDDDEFFRVTGDETNSVAIIMKHVGGNLRSRWTDFLSTDGEKADRNRDGEFIAEERRADIMAIWQRGFDALAETLRTLRPEDLTRTVTIRGEPHTVIHALNRNLAHTAQHVGQIVLLAKQWRGPEWQTLSLPRAPRARTP